MEHAWAWNAKKIGMQKEMLDKWQQAGIDVVIAPAGPHTAVLPGDWTFDTYTVAWNAMDVSIRCGILREWKLMCWRVPCCDYPVCQSGPRQGFKGRAFRRDDWADAAVQALCESRSMLKFNVC
jgi:hypothetical protein